MRYIAAFVLLIGLLSGQQVIAGEKGLYQNWNTELSGKTNEAYTIADQKTSFGMFCSGEQCMFYLHQGLNCTSGGKYSVLMNSPGISTALSMECASINGSVFQILNPFDVVLKATQVGDSIGFAVALQSGDFAVARFSLHGAKSAIDRVLAEAVASKQREQRAAPPVIAMPPVIVLPQIQITPQVPQNPKPKQNPNSNQNPSSKDISI